MDGKVENFAEVTASITMSKSLYIAAPEGISKEELLENAKKEFNTPDKIIELYKEVLRHFGVQLNINDIDIKDWNVDEIEYITDYTPNVESSN